MHNRRKFLAQFAMAAGAVTFLRPLNGLAGIGANIPGLNNTNKLTLLHTANLNGQWKSLAANERLVGLGGLENLCKKVQEIRQENTHVLLVDAGNLMARQSTDRHAQLLFYRRMAKAGYDAVVPGETDLANGVSYFRELVEESNISVVAAQYGRIERSMGNILPYYLVNKGNLQIAFIDCSTHALKKLPNYSFARAVAAASATATRLKEKDPCLLTLCLIQEDQAKSRAFAEASSHLDIIASTASVQVLQNILVIRNSKNEEVLLSRAGEKGTMMSRIDLTYNENLEKIHVNSSAVLVGAPLVKYAALSKQDAYGKG